MIRIFALAAISAIPAHADGLGQTFTDPEVMRPAETWTGPYAALSYARVKGTKDTTVTTETTECFKLGTPYACDDPIFLQFPDFKDERTTVTQSTVTTETTDGAAGVVLGYRFDAGRIVPGVDLGIYGGDVVPGVSVGVDLGRVLPYAHYSSDGAALGVDVRLGDRLTVGARAAEGSAAVMVGVKW